MPFKQFAALPYRIEGKKLNVLLITTRRKHRWSVPKGWPVEGGPTRTVEIEALEEAGVIGLASQKDIGRFKIRKQKGRRKVTCNIKVFPLEVQKQKRRWLEKEERTVIWLPADKAADLVHRPHLKRVISRFARKYSPLD